MANNMVTLDEIDRGATELYMQGDSGYEILSDAWDRIPSGEEHLYPEIAYQMAKVFISRGIHAEARKCLAFCLLAWENILEKRARVFLMHAQLSYQELNFTDLRYYVAKVRELSKSETYLAECQFLLGEALKTSSPDLALQHFEASRRDYLRISTANPRARFDAIRASCRAAEVAFWQNKLTLGWRYLNEAERLAQDIGDNVLLSAVLIQCGEAYERQGHYHNAMSYYDHAAQISTSDASKAEVSYYSARLAVLMNDDKTAQRELETSMTIDHWDLLCNRLLLYGWLHALNYRFAQAAAKLAEARDLQGDNFQNAARVNLLHGLISAQSGTVDMGPIRDAVRFFESHLMPIETSQAKLILAWLYALSGDGLTTQKLVRQVEDEIQLIGHVNHLARFYEVSMPILGGWWTAVTRDRMHSALKKYNMTGTGVWIYAFGTPRIYVHNGILLYQRDRYGYISVKLLLYMLEKRRAGLWEIVTALWPESDPFVARNRFHALMSGVKKNIGVPDWCMYSAEYSRYEIKDDFPYYYDVDDFNRAYKLFFKSESPAQKLAICFKLVNLYNVFAKGIEGEFFHELRLMYQARYEGILSNIQNLLPEFESMMPSDWHEQLLDSIRVNMNSS